MRSKPPSRAIDSLLSLDLLPALESGDCSVCQVLRQRVHRYIDWFLIETYNSPPLLDRLADSGGFCPAHFRDIVSRTPAWQTWQMSFVTEVLVRYYLDLIATIRKDLSHGWNTVTPLRSGAWKRLLPRGECPLCSDFRSWETWVINGLAKLFADGEWSAQVGRAPVCVPHLTDVCRLSAGDDAAVRCKALRDLEAACPATDGKLDTLSLRRFLCGDPLQSSAAKVRPPFLNEVKSRLRPQGRPRRRTLNRVAEGQTTPLPDPLSSSQCPVCLQSRHAVAASFASGWPSRRLERLCRTHLARLLERGEELPPGRLKVLTQRLARLFAEGSLADDLPATCPVCGGARAAEEGTAAAIAAHAQGQVRTRAGVICLRHLPGVIRQASPTAAAVVLEREEVELREIVRLLKEYFGKRDYRYNEEPKGEEQDAWRRALQLLAGANEEWESHAEGGKDE